MRDEPLTGERAPGWAAAERAVGIGDSSAGNSRLPNGPAGAETSCRHDLRRAVRVAGITAGVSAALWLLTPVVSSFATFVQPHLFPAIFTPAEHNGASCGDTPVELYGLLAVILGIVNVVVFTINVVFGMRTKFTAITVLGIVFGIVVFWTLQLGADGAFWVWWIAPFTGVIGYVVAQALTTLETRTRLICLGR